MHASLVADAGSDVHIRQLTFDFGGSRLSSSVDFNVELAGLPVVVRLVTARSIQRMDVEQGIMRSRQRVGQTVNLESKRDGGRGVAIDIGTEHGCSDRVACGLESMGRSERSSGIVNGLSCRVADTDFHARSRRCASRETQTDLCLAGHTHDSQ